MKESGGFIDNLNGEGFLTKKIDFIASNTKIHEKLRSFL